MRPDHVSIVRSTWALATPDAESLGRRHVGYGVQDTHYETAGRALLDPRAATFRLRSMPPADDAAAA